MLPLAKAVVSIRITTGKARGERARIVKELALAAAAVCGGATVDRSGWGTYQRKDNGKVDLEPSWAVSVCTDNPRALLEAWAPIVEAWMTKHDQESCLLTHGFNSYLVFHTSFKDEWKELINKLEEAPA